MPRPRLAPPPAWQCYDCHTSGQCCQGYFEVAVTEAERERILQQGWAALPEYAGQALVVPRHGGWVLANRADGACVFHGEDGLCRIHARFGEPAKPLACRLYPFVFVPAGDEVRVDLRFDCPSVAGSRGRELPQHVGELKQLLAQAVPTKGFRPSTTARLAVGVDVAWAVVRQVTQALETVLDDISLSMVQRVLTVSAVAAMLPALPLDQVAAGSVPEMMTVLIASCMAEALSPDSAVAPPTRMVRLLFRQMVGLYGRADRLSQPPRVGARLAASLRLAVGRGLFPRIRPDFPAVSFAAVEATAADLDQHGSEAVSRYYRTKLNSLGFFGPGFYGETYQGGLAALCLTYPILLWYARLFAAGEGLAAPDEAAVVRAIQVVDRNHGRTPLLDTRTERARRQQLSGFEVLRSLLAAQRC